MNRQHAHPVYHVRSENGIDFYRVDVRPPRHVWIAGEPVTLARLALIAAATVAVVAALWFFCVLFLTAFGTPVR